MDLLGKLVNEFANPDSVMRRAVGGAAQAAVAAVTPAAFPLCDAARAGDAARVTELLDAGASANERRAGLGSYGYSALHEACHARAPAVIERLLARGADAGARSAPGLVSGGQRTPLHVAAERDAGACAAALLAAQSAAGCDANAACQHGWRAVHYAAAAGALGALGALLSAPATDAAAVVGDGRGALDIALERCAAAGAPDGLGLAAARLLLPRLPPGAAAAALLRCVEAGNDGGVSALGELGALPAPLAVETIAGALGALARAREATARALREERAAARAAIAAAVAARAGAGAGAGDGAGAADANPFAADRAIALEDGLIATIGALAR